MRILLRCAFILGILLIMIIPAFAGVKYSKTRIIASNGTLSIDLPEWVDLTRSGTLIEVKTATGETFTFNRKEPTFTRIKARRNCELNKGLLYFSSTEMGSFQTFIMAANIGNAVCSCDDPSCIAGASISVPDKTYVTNFSHESITYLISFIIEQNGLTVTIIDESDPENYIKALFVTR